MLGAVAAGNRTAALPVAATYACEDPFTLTGELKGRLGFGGFVVSDWGATHSTVASALAGLDMEMGSEKYYGAALVAAVKAGRVDEGAVDDKAERVLRSSSAVCKRCAVRLCGASALLPRTGVDQQLAYRCYRPSRR